MLLYSGGPPTPHDLWQSWSFAPAVAAGIAVTGWIHARGIRALWLRDGTVLDPHVQHLLLIAVALGLFVAWMRGLDARVSPGRAMSPSGMARLHRPSA